MDTHLKIIFCLQKNAVRFTYILRGASRVTTHFRALFFKNDYVKNNK